MGDIKVGDKVILIKGPIWDQKPQYRKLEYEATVMIWPGLFRISPINSPLPDAYAFSWELQKDVRDFYA